MNDEHGLLETLTKSHSYKLALNSILIVAAGAAAAVAVLYFSLNRGAGDSYAESFSIISELKKQLLHKATVTYLITSFFIVVGIAVISLLYSHRVAGPLHRLGMYARRISSGDLSDTVQLRGNDAIHPMADDLNNVITAYRDVLERLEQGVEGLKKEVQELSRASDAGVTEEIGKSLNRVGDKTDEIREILSYVKL